MSTGSEMYEGPGGQQQQQTGGPGGGYGPGPGYGGGWGRGGGWGMGPRAGMRPQYPIETKPFLLTSEFLFSLLAVIALLIKTLTSDSIDARGFWTYTTAILFAYLLSRGIAKSGTKSRSWDPREDIGRPSDRGSDR